MRDSYRLLVNGPCLQCHQVGNLTAGNKEREGPPLHQIHNRLRPGWLERWLANPQRYLTYPTIMPSNFPADQAPGTNQEWLAGSPLEQLRGLRDVLMRYPEASALPVNQPWAVPIPGEKK